MLDKNNLTQKAFKNLAPIRKMSVSEWADTFRMLPSTSSEPGRFKTNRTPYMRDIMDAFTDDNIHRVVAMTSSQVGKALDIDTPIPTPDGWTLMRDLKTGDKVFDEQGEICNVTSVSEIMTNRKCFGVGFSDGAVIFCDAQHLWTVSDWDGEFSRQTTLSTEIIFRTFKQSGYFRYSVPATKSINLPEKIFSESPTSIGEKISHNKLKKIPPEYLRGSNSQRWELVFNLHPLAISGELAEQINELFKSLGNGIRTIFDVWEVESRPVKCIAVDSPRHLYLAGKNFIPTHNSEALNCVVGRFAHLDPCTILLVQPTEGLAEKYSKTRIVPMILDTKVLTPLFNSRNQTILEKFFTGGQLLMTGSNSPANLASQPVRIVLCDEVDRFATDLPGEGDPVKLAAARTTTFWNYKIGLFSTPTVKGLSRIEMEYLTGTQEEWSYKCPNCGEFHKLDFRYFVKGAADSEKIKHYFRCPDCGMDFSEMEMKSSEQKYIAKNPDAYSKGIRSFWVNAFSSAWLSWEQIFQDWEEAKGNPALEKVCYNTRFAESYEYIEENVNEDVYLKRRENYFAELPPKVLLLTAAVDVQGNRLEYEVVGWSSDLHSWGILRGIISGSPNQPETWAQLDSILDREFKFHNGKRLKIARAFIDSGFATRKVYDYCAENQIKGRFAIKGKGSAGLPLISSYSYPRGYGITLTILGVNDGKQEIFSRLNLKNCMMHFPRDDEFFRRRGYDETYFSQIFSEKRVLKHSSGVSYFAFEPVRRDVRNESLDLAVYNFAALQSLQPNWEKLEQDINGDISAPSVKKARSKSKISSTSLF